MTKPSIVMANWTNITDETICKKVLYLEIEHSRVRVWDLAILIPNALFLVFLLARLKRARTKLKQTSTPIFSAFFGLVWVSTGISIIRCVVSMTVNAALPVGDYVDKVLWLILRLFLLSTEMSVVTFGMAFGHLDSKTSIRRVLICTSTISLIYSGTQGALEFVNPDDSFHIDAKNYDLFGHGGMLFWFISSIFFSVIYSVIDLLPWTPVSYRLALPTKKSFYLYCLFLAFLNLVQAVGSGMLFYKVQPGMCIVDLTTYIYFTVFTPLVYRTFLSDFFGSTPPPTILFSYKAQQDELAEDDTVSLPQHSYSSTKTDSDIIFHGNSAMYESTHFDVHGSPSLQYDDADGFHSSVLLTRSLHEGIGSINASMEASVGESTHRRRSSDPVTPTVVHT
ncbi:PREDICTED: transmembrane protein adipocyte-associated 1 homolog [Priapulus caudatus]|uniref:Transmembrane protein adipocyte-associated 1 homolog n=1 Tax=Priapulus caudatus TaxID=37621 RepID=A0ABM1DXK0_PRICU|nr:PREDICTED: transmembrane protein adipocyte-associated 1 homolog [Priapulus caudatus]